MKEVFIAVYPLVLYWIYMYIYGAISGVGFKTW